MFHIGKKWSRLVTAIGLAILVLLAFAYGVGVGVRHWPPFAQLKRMKALTRQTALSRLAEAAAPIALLARSQAGSSKSEQARFARQFVYDHSIHRIDEEHQRYALNTPVVLRMLRDHYRTGRAPPHLSCGPRALALAAILDALSIENRIVDVFSGDYEDVRSHTFVEVFDEQSRRWAIQDPDFDVTYEDRRTGQPVCLMRLILGDLESAIPVSRRGRGWEINQVDHLKKHYFQAARYDTRADDCNILVVNTDRFPLAKRFPLNDNMTFQEFSEKNHRRPVFLLNNTLSVAYPE